MSRHLDGDAAFIAALYDTADKIRSQVRVGLRDAGEILLTEARTQVPFDTGALSESGSVTAHGDDVVVGFDTPYAVVQHERLDFRHTNGRKAKYLEDPANDSAIRDAMGAAIWAKAVDHV